MEDRNEQGRYGFADFMSFKKLISGVLVQFVYAIGVVYIFVSGIEIVFKKEYGFFSAINSNNHVMIGLLIIVVGNILWRLLCEAYIVIFQMHDLLVSIKSSTSQECLSADQIGLKTSSPLAAE